MGRNTVKTEFTRSQISELRQRYRLFNCSSDQVVKTVLDQKAINPNFHTKNLSSNRTVE